MEACTFTGSSVKTFFFTTVQILCYFFYNWFNYFIVSLATQILNKYVELFFFLIIRWTRECQGERSLWYYTLLRLNQIHGWSECMSLCSLLKRISTLHYYSNNLFFSLNKEGLMTENTCVGEVQAQRSSTPVMSVGPLICLPVRLDRGQTWKRSFSVVTKRRKWVRPK